MMKFILIVIGVFAAALLFINYVYRKIAGIFSFFTGTKNVKQKPTDSRDDVLYEDKNVTVHRGEAHTDNND